MKLKKLIENCYLCIRFPFLYTRNRFNNLHYTNWKIYTYLYGERAKYKCIKTEDGVYKSVIETPATDGLWGKAFENVQETKHLKDGSHYNSLHTVTKSKFWATWYYIVEFWYEHVLQWIHCIPTFTELDQMEPGWRKAFGIQMCKEIKQALLKVGGRKMLREYRIMQIKEKFGCYDDQTELLTKSGWKYFKDLVSTDEIATLENGVLKYYIPKEIMEYDYSGKMYKLVNRGLDLLVTPNHNLYVAKGSYFYHKNNNQKTVYPFEFCTPDKYFRKDKRFLKTCKWTGIVPEEKFVIPEWKHVRQFNKTSQNTRTYVMPEFKCNIHDFLKFLGFYVAEGYTKHGFGTGSTISIAYNPKDEEDLVINLLTNIGITKWSNGRGLKRFSNATLAKWLKENCGHLAPNKKVPEFIKNLSSEYIEKFLTYLYIGDGHQTKTSNILTTTSKQLSDDVCELLLKCGYAFSVNSRVKKPSNKQINGRTVTSKHLVYEISWLKLPEIEIDMSKAKHTKSFIEEWIDYSGKVYCVNVPNHIIYVRRNGKGCWCGNSLCWYDAWAPKEVHDIISKYEDISYNTCICCGKPATKISSGWISPYCDNCYPTYKDGGSPMVQQEKVNGEWQETEEYHRAWDEIEKQYAKDKEKI